MYVNLETFYDFFEFATIFLKFLQHYESFYKKVDVHKLNTLTLDKNVGRICQKLQFIY
jgi:hypothetical protein